MHQRHYLLSIILEAFLIIKYIRSITDYQISQRYLSNALEILLIIKYSISNTLEASLIINYIRGITFLIIKCISDTHHYQIH
jgi:hypothetical protein